MENNIVKYCLCIKEFKPQNEKVVNVYNNPPGYYGNSFTNAVSWEYTVSYSNYYSNYILNPMFTKGKVYPLFGNCIISDNLMTVDITDVGYKDFFITFDFEIDKITQKIIEKIKILDGSPGVFPKDVSYNEETKEITIKKYGGNLCIKPQYRSFCVEGDNLITVITNMWKRFRTNIGMVRIIDTCFKTTYQRSIHSVYSTKAYPTVIREELKRFDNYKTIVSLTSQNN